MENEKYLLRQQTLRRYILAMTRRGAAGIITDPGCRKRYLVMVAIITLVVLVLMRPAPDNPLWNLIPMVMNAAWTAIWLILCLAAVPACGYIPSSWSMYDDLTRAGIVNFAVEAPLLIARQNGEHGIIKLIFQIKGYPIARWQEDQVLIESALNLSILEIHPGLDNQTIEIEAVKASGAFNHLVPWLDALRPDDPAELALGVNAAGIPLIINLSKIPHWLIGAATGGGKTKLLKLILHQLRMAGYILYLADFKGVDFRVDEFEDGHYATELKTLAELLDEVVTILYARRDALIQAKCPNIDLYNESHFPLKRIVVVLDETSMILDSTGRSKEEKAEIAEILNQLLTIGRLGRAMGIHLIVATQRPDVASVPGALKAQLDGRICGHCADAQSSIVILDDGSGAKLPAVPGRFIVRDGDGCDKIIQAFLLNDKKGENNDV